MEPIPLVSITTRKVMTPEPMKTRVGNAFMDHPAGMPLPVQRPSRPLATQPIPQAMLSSFPPPRPVTSARDWDEQPSFHPSGYLRPRFQGGLQGNDDPVQLPMRSRATTYVVLVALVLGFIGVLVTVAVAGSSHTLRSRNEPAVQKK